MFTFTHLDKRVRSLLGTAPSFMGLLLLGACVLVIGCSSGANEKKVRAAAQSKIPLVWPAAPEEPRIEYQQSIRQPGDVGIKRSAIVRFARWVVGSDKGSEQFGKPFGVAVDENDNLCITDTGSNAVSYWDRSKKKWQRWETIGKKLHFSSPVGIAKRKGVFYVADSGLASIVAFDESGKLRFRLTDKLERPTGVVATDDKLFVVDSQRHSVFIFDLNGRYVSEFGRRGTGDGEFNFPTHIALNATGDLLVTDSMNSRIQVLEQNGTFKSQIGSIGDSPGEFSRPKGVATDSFGHVYVVDALFDNMQIFDLKGKLLLNFAGSGSAPGQFWLPNGVAISRNNEIFVADSYNGRIQMFKYVGKP